MKKALIFISALILIVIALLAIPRGDLSGMTNEPTGEFSDNSCP